MNTSVNVSPQRLRGIVYSRFCKFVFVEKNGFAFAFQLFHAYISLAKIFSSNGMLCKLIGLIVFGNEHLLSRYFLQNMKIDVG